MVTSDAIAILREQIEAAKGNGLSEVSLGSLSKLVDMIEVESSQSPEGVEAKDARLEQFKSQLGNWQNENQRDHETQLELVRATIETSHLAIKSALLINGGAAVAFLAFLGTAWSRFSSVSVKATLASSLEQFIVGVMLTGVGAGVAYICQMGFSGQLGKFSGIAGEVLRWLAVVLIMSSFWMFYRGCSFALEAFIAGG